MEEAVLKLGQGLEPFCVQPPVEPALQRRLRVLPEVEPVPAVDGLEQEADLELLELALRSAAPGRFRAGLGVQWYSHTRINESSWSVSTGFVM